jgi:hypothetical protein
MSAGRLLTRPGHLTETPTDRQLTVSMRDALMERQQWRRY